MADRVADEANRDAATGAGGGGEESRGLRVRIVGAEKRLGSQGEFFGGSFVVYNINVSRDDRRWQVHRRYSNFDALHTELAGRYATQLARVRLPSKHPLANISGSPDADSEFVRKR